MRLTWQEHAPSERRLQIPVTAGFSARSDLHSASLGETAEYDRSIEVLLRHRAPLGGASQLASLERCPGCPPRGDPDRSWDYPRQTDHLEGGAGADGAAEPDRSVEASQESESA